MAGLVVGGKGSGDGRERNACGGRISISGGLGQLTGGGSVVQAHKATVDSASSIDLNGHIDGNILEYGVALLADDADAVDVLGDNLDGGLRLHVGKDRLHRTGMRWSEAGAEGILALRCIESSGRRERFCKSREQARAARYQDFRQTTARAA